jgi:hypothetical protein
MWNGTAVTGNDRLCIISSHRSSDGDSVNSRDDFVNPTGARVILGRSMFGRRGRVRNRRGLLYGFHRGIHDGWRFV